MINTIEKFVKLDMERQILQRKFDRGDKTVYQELQTLIRQCDEIKARMEMIENSGRLPTNER